MDFSKTNFNFVGRAKIWYTFSIILTGIGIIAMIWRTVETGYPLKRGIDFTGGSIISLEFDNWPADKTPVDFADQVTGFVSQYTQNQPQVQTSLSEDKTTLTLDIRADASLIGNKDSEANLFNQIKSAGGDFKVLEESEVGAVMGVELTKKALWGVLIGNFLILMYITFRLAFDFGLCAIVGLIHDILVVLTVFAIFNLEINSSFVAILLTVVGYSIQDTIIIYDRVRENMKVKRHLPFDKLVNVSLNETLTRSINTTLTIVLAILALLIFGGASIKIFMVGLAVGISTGAYSSIFICSPLIVTWRLRGKGSVVLTEKVRPEAVLDIDDDLIDVRKARIAQEDEEAGQVDQIALGTGVGTPKRQKRRKRRY
jgi:preprotein translocase subunit SecF